MVLYHYDICRYRFIQVVDNGVYIIMIYVDIDLYRWWIMVLYHYDICRYRFIQVVDNGV